MAKGYHPIRRRSSDPIPESHFSQTNNNSCVSSSNRTSMESLRRGLTLPLNNMAIPIYTASPPSREDVEVGGRVLFQHFIQEELLHHGIPDEMLEVENPPPDAFGDIGPELMHGDGNGARAASPAFASTPDGYKTANFINIGANIKKIADKFAESHERQLIRDQADEVDLGHISYTTFYNMMRELFRDGINKYRIISLFFFCSDVLIRCIKNELYRLGSKLFFWALEFLCNNVCNWVRDNGGWERVFSNIYKVVIRTLSVVAIVVGVGCGIVYLKKNT